MITSLVVWLLIGAIAGWLASLIIKGHGLGLAGNIVVGIVGAVIAGWLLPLIGFVFIGGILAAIINAVIGAVLLLVIIGFVQRKMAQQERRTAPAKLEKPAIGLHLGTIVQSGFLAFNSMAYVFDPPNASRSHGRTAPVSPLSRGRYARGAQLPSRRPRQVRAE